MANPSWGTGRSPHHDLSMYQAASTTLIWTIALAIPFQGVPARSCDCTASRSAVSASTCGRCSSQQAKSCCFSLCPKHGCCSSEHRQAKACCCCCCQAGSGCQHCTCSIDCPCRQAKPLPPSAPPAEQRPLDEVLTLGLASVSTVAVVPSLNSQPSIVTIASSDGMRAVDRCISLCRFTL